MRRGYTPVGPVTVRRDFWHHGPIPDGYDVYIEERDLRSERDHGHIWMGGYHRVVVTGPQPRPRSKAFIGETAWSDAERYAHDVVAALQLQARRAAEREARQFLDDHFKVVHVMEV